MFYIGLQILIQILSCFVLFEEQSIFHQFIFILYSFCYRTLRIDICKHVWLFWLAGLYCAFGDMKNINSSVKRQH